MINELIVLAEKGNEFIDGFDPQNPSQEYNDWRGTCLSVICTLYGKGSREYDGFRRALGVNAQMISLKMLAMREENEHNKPLSGITVNQSTTILNEMSLEINLNIEHSGLSDSEKEEIRKIYEEVKSEVVKKETNWSKVTGLLKKSLDYGLKVAPDIIKLAALYYNAKR